MDQLQGLQAAVAELQAEVRRQRDEILLLRSVSVKTSTNPNPPSLIPKNSTVNHTSSTLGFLQLKPNCESMAKQLETLWHNSTMCT